MAVKIEVEKTPDVEVEFISVQLDE